LQILRSGEDSMKKVWKKFDKFMKQGRIDKVTNLFMPKVAS